MCSVEPWDWERRVPSSQDCSVFATGGASGTRADHEGAWRRGARVWDGDAEKAVFVWPRVLRVGRTLYKSGTHLRLRASYTVSGL